MLLKTLCITIVFQVFLPLGRPKFYLAKTKGDFLLVKTNGVKSGISGSKRHENIEAGAQYWFVVHSQIIECLMKVWNHPLPTAPHRTVKWRGHPLATTWTKRKEKWVYPPALSASCQQERWISPLWNHANDTNSCSARGCNILSERFRFILLYEISTENVLV